MFGNGIFNNDGAEWKAHRALTRPFFGKSQPLLIKCMASRSNSIAGRFQLENASPTTNTSTSTATECLIICDSDPRLVNRSIFKTSSPGSLSTRQVTPISCHRLGHSNLINLNIGEFLFGTSEFNTLEEPLPRPGKSTLGPLGSAVDGTYGGFVQAFEKIQLEAYVASVTSPRSFIECLVLAVVVLRLASSGPCLK